MEHEFPSFAFGHGARIMLSRFEQALFSGKISFTLLSLWQQKNGSVKYVGDEALTCGDSLSEERVARCFLFAAATMLVGSYLSYWYFKTHKDLHILMAAIAIIVGLAGMVSYNKVLLASRHLQKKIFKRVLNGVLEDPQLVAPHKQFLADLDVLDYYIGLRSGNTTGLGYFHKEDLIALVEEKMSSLTSHVLDLEKRGKTGDVNHAFASELVKGAYGIFSRFGLTQDPLGEYYKRPTALTDPAYDLIRKNEEVQACNMATAEVPDVKTVVRDA